MNPSPSPYPNHHPFPYPPQNPIPNPNYYFHSLPYPPPPPPPHSTAQPPQIPPSTTTTTSTATPVPDLSTTLFSLNHLLTLTRQTLDSVSSLLSPLPTSPKPQNADHVACPYNPHHLMPAEYLFLHSLHCPSPVSEDPTSLVNSLHYPKTTPSSQNLAKNLFTQSIDDPSKAQLCFSLDSYYSEFSSNFFYKDCPGVVNFNGLDSLKRTFTLPGNLSIECANFVTNSEAETKDFDKNELRIMPSQLWAIRNEIEGWVDYPSVYSYSVLCAILRLNLIKGSDLGRWVIANSPRYGVVIDVYMRDHLYLLFRLCLKAIRKEALGLVGFKANMKILSFKCPVLVQVLMWIASQLAVLYGEENAKRFVIHIFKHCVLEGANNVMLFPMESNLKESSTNSDAIRIDPRDVKFEEPVEGSTDCKVAKGLDESVDGEVIFVTQVAAAVAALHERTFLEGKIKGSRVFQPLPRYQRKAELDCISKRADEEREKRPNYRAIIEHDGLRKQSCNQETSKNKSKLDLLAEERDYKRRRMSYRGKKLKRTTLQVMRDIIDEYMENIKQAGGIGCFETGTEEEGTPSKPPYAVDVTMDVDKLRKSNSDSSETLRPTPNHYNEQTHSDHNMRPSTFENATPRNYDQQGQGHHSHDGHLDYHSRSSSRQRHDRDYSGSPERRRSCGRLHEQSCRRREQDDVELTSSNRLEKKSHRKSNRHNSKSSYYVPDSAFEDRYDPTESNDMNEDSSAYADSKYIGPTNIHE